MRKMGTHLMTHEGSKQCYRQPPPFRHCEWVCLSQKSALTPKWQAVILQTGDNIGYNFAITFCCLPSPHFLLVGL